MKQIVCEMCGSADLVKQDGMYVCQNCGTKYSVEEAKKLMIDGPVTVTGKVKIDHSDEYDRLVTLGNDAFTDNRFDAAYEYYSKAISVSNDDPLVVSRQGLSILGKEDIISSVPTSCENAVERAIALANTNSDVSISTFAAGLIVDIAVVTQYKIIAFKNEIKSLTNEKVVERSAGQILGDLAEPQFVASQNQRDDRIKQEHNQSIDQKIARIKAKLEVVSKYSEEVSERVVKLISSELLLETGVRLIQTQDQNATRIVFNRALNEGCNASVAYLGLGAAEVLIDLKTGVDALISYISRAIEAFKEDDLRNFHDLFDGIVNADCYLEHQWSLLMITAMRYDVAGTEFLLKLGANPDYHSEPHNQTPLFMVSYTKPEHPDKALQIAKSLLHYNVDTNVVSSGGVSLLNSDTDPAIRAEILNKNPQTVSGQKAGGNGGCYVATAVYGSYDCPQVWTLRRYRDNTLAETWYGRLFIYIYYAISPTLVKWFGDTEWFKGLWKPKLDRIVERLNSEGVENTPYSDRNW